MANQQEQLTTIGKQEFLDRLALVWRARWDAEEAAFEALILRNYEEVFNVEPAKRVNVEQPPNRVKLGQEWYFYQGTATKGVMYLYASATSPYAYLLGNGKVIDADQGEILGDAKGLLFKYV